TSTFISPTNTSPLRRTKSSPREPSCVAAGRSSHARPECRMNRPHIRLENVGKTYHSRDGAVEACADVNIDIKQSEFVAIVGPSGCGKTTILKMVAGLIPYSSGTITIGDKLVDRPQTDVGIVFQDAIMLDWRNVLSNVMLQIDIRHMDRGKYKAVAKSL